MSHFKKNWFWYILTLILISGGGYLYYQGDTSIKILEKQLEAEKAFCQDKIDQRETLIINEQLPLAAKAFSWAIRGAILRKNFDEADQMIKEFVAEPSVRGVQFVDKNDLIYLASDKKIEGKKYTEMYGSSLIGKNEIILEKNDLAHIAKVPVMSLSERIGTVIIYYRPDYSEFP